METPGPGRRKGHREYTENFFREEREEGLMDCFTEEEVIAEWGTRRAVAAIAAIEEGEKIRIIHDGTHDVQVNHAIRVRDLGLHPDAGGPGAKEDPRGPQGERD